MHIDVVITDICMIFVLKQFLSSYLVAAQTKNWGGKVGGRGGQEVGLGWGLGSCHLPLPNLHISNESQMYLSSTRLPYFLACKTNVFWSSLSRIGWKGSVVRKYDNRSFCLLWKRSKSNAAHEAWMLTNYWLWSLFLSPWLGRGSCCSSNLNWKDWD